MKKMSDTFRLTTFEGIDTRRNPGIYLQTGKLLISINNKEGMKITRKNKCKIIFTI